MEKPNGHILHQSLCGYWEWDPLEDHFYLSPEAKKMLGYSDDDPFLDTLKSFEALLLADDAGLFIQKLQACATENTGLPFVVTVRFLSKSGHVMEMVATAWAAGWNSENRPTEIVGYIVAKHGQEHADRKSVREHLDVIFEESTNAYLLMDEKGIIDCNNAAVRMMGLDSKAEMLSSQPSVFSPEFQPDGRRSDEKSVEMDMLAHERGVNCFEWVHRRKNGTDVLIDVTLNPVKVGGRTVLLVVWHDITERKRAEQQLLKSEALLNETQELTHSGSWEYDLQNGENNWSAESFRIFGLAPSSGPPTDLFADMIHPDDRYIYDDAIKNAIRYKVSSDLELRIILETGTVKWIRAIGKPFIDPMGRVTKLHGAISDVTKEKAASEALKKAKEQAEQAAIAKSQFLTAMSHEIRTPMNAVIGFTHLLMRDAREDQMEFLKVLKFSGENLLVLINDILDFSKIEAGKIDLEEVDFGLKELMANIKSALLHKARSKGLKLKLLIDDDLPEFLMGDPVRLNQILTNLVANAVKFTETGSVIVSALLSRQDKEATTVYFEVRDTGIGIAEDKQENIFESFTQASSDTTRVYGGTGLGLTITKRLLELMGSNIRLKSKLGEGAVFHFELSLKSSKKKPVVQQESSTVLEKKDLKGLKLLVADDNRINILLARELLRQWEVECDVAENGLEALELVKNKDYDMVLMDLQMPGMDGYQATQEIRKLAGEKYQRLPIIALTASAMLDIRDKALALGMDGYLSKPFNPDELYRKIRKFTADALSNG